MDFFSTLVFGSQEIQRKYSIGLDSYGSVSQESKQELGLHGKFPGAKRNHSRALPRLFAQFFSALRCFWRTKTTRTEGEGVPAVLIEGDGVAPIASQATPCHRPHDIHPPARRREPPQRRQPSLRRPHTTSAPSQRRHPPESTSSITDPHLASYL